MKNIVISGYYGFNNLGDEAVLAGITSLLKNKNEKLKITVLSASPQKTAELYDVNSVSRTSLIQILAALAEADLFISGGGSLLQDVTGSFSVPYYLGLAWLAKMQNTKTVYYAQGAGPLNKWWSQKITALTLNRFDILGVRDLGSKNLLKEIDVKKKIELTVDPVFALYDPLNNMRQQIKGKIEVGISVRPWSIDYLSELAAGLNKFAQTNNIKFVLFPMHQGADEKISRELKGKLKAETEICDLPAVPGEALKAFSQLDLFVGVRLHSLIFALLNQIPLLALSYDPKIEGLMTELDYLPLIKLEDLEAAEIAEKLETIFAERYSLRKKIKEFLKQKTVEAENFAELVLEEVDSCGS
ncbi:polysaccharide pyruvyl transferase CsaB [Halanaerobium saccharolyticum]|uniref:Polysaccharide pyruvyl transferase CsaB n=1 Tax=Halanaerobium saccharolyticum TaxID=43595 RepID=A0A4R7Z8K0_9FIRM|nr:polysaccharide pyruvyl transferase CsaB [Halanaerobium saccharolyticum]RAK09763.1 polysaccharide pyruvyl transferase CsaB [Halanaerobium saccharolyticum]TDW07325.1 polysaccharide pyruvyl transferase CsaB [Halanaerobium saccharolyticum]TDX61204.1 polysaccharide pyruvyl transferase CsaB [Halanaerobium saccharolyticum]